MKKIDQESVANITFEMQWKSSSAIHTEVYEAQGLNIWRDCLPENLVGERVAETDG